MFKIVTGDLSRISNQQPNSTKQQFSIEEPSVSKPKGDVLGQVQVQEYNLLT